MELVTFLITTYNSEKWIKECIDSVCHQSYSNLQILIIDDGSIDDTPKIISEIQEPRIDFYVKPHSGISKSLNFAMNKIRGYYVARLGSDDYCNIDRIKFQIEFIKKNPEYGIVGSNYYLIDSMTNRLKKMRNPEKDEWIKDLMPRRCCVWDGSTLFNSDIFKTGFNESLSVGEDWDFFLRALDYTKFYNLTQYLTYKRVHSQNISSSSFAHLEFKKIAMNYNKSLITVSNDLIKISQSYFNIGSLYYYDNEFKKAEAYFRVALKNRRNSVQIYRYLIFTKYFSWLVKFIRKRKYFRFFRFFRFLDRRNKFFRNEA